MENQLEAEAGSLMDAIQMRRLEESDLLAMIRIDSENYDHPRESFLREKLEACIKEPGINVSLAAEMDGVVVGFLLGKLFFGEFGIPAQRAVLEVVGVRPNMARKGIGRLLLEQFGRNMVGLRVEAIDTLVGLERPDLLAFFQSAGFKPSRAVDLVWNMERFPFKGAGGGNRVRDAEAEDIESIAAIDKEYAFESRSQFFQNRLRSAKKFPARNLFIVAECEGSVCGYMLGSLYRGEFGIDLTRGVIDTFGVRENARHQGVASVLMENALERLNRLQVTHMETLCRWNDWEVLRFFEYVGFRPSSRVNLEWRLD